MPDKSLEWIVPLIGFLGFFLLVGWAIATVAEGRRRMVALKTRSELNNKILEKYGSAREFLDFLQSEAGQKFLDTVTVEPSSPATRVLGAVHKGVIAVSVGVGLLSIPVLMGDNTEIFKVFGILTLSLGAGFLISALLSYRLSRSLGLIPSVPDSLPRRLAAQP
jgi:hypothetical protein